MDLAKPGLTRAPAKRRTDPPSSSRNSGVLIGTTKPHHTVTSPSIKTLLPTPTQKQRRSRVRCSCRQRSRLVPSRGDNHVLSADAVEGCGLTLTRLAVRPALGGKQQMLKHGHKAGDELKRCKKLKRSVERSLLWYKPQCLRPQIGKT
jgi:hypothetical protein